MNFFFTSKCSIILNQKSILLSSLQKIVVIKINTISIKFCFHVEPMWRSTQENKTTTFPNLAWVHQGTRHKAESFVDYVCAYVCILCLFVGLLMYVCVCLYILFVGLFTYLRSMIVCYRLFSVIVIYLRSKKIELSSTKSQERVHYTLV